MKKYTSKNRALSKLRKAKSALKSLIRENDVMKAKILPLEEDRLSWKDAWAMQREATGKAYMLGRKEKK